MTWAKLDDSATDDPALLALPRGVRLLAIEGLVWSCRHLTDGEIPRHALRRLTDEPDIDAAAEALVAAGRWAATDDGWRIVGFLEDQPSKGDVEKARALTAVRVRRSRQHKAGDHSLCDPDWCRRAAGNGVTDAVSSAVSSGTPIRPTRPDKGRGKGEGAGAASRAPGGAASGPALDRKTEAEIAALFGEDGEPIDISAVLDYAETLEMAVEDRDEWGIAAATRLLELNPGLVKLTAALDAAQADS